MISGLDDESILMQVTFMESRRQTISGLKAVLALFLAVVVFGLSLAAVYPELHKALHAEEGHCHHDELPSGSSPDDGHICGVTLLLTGTCLLTIFELSPVGIVETIALTIRDEVSRSHYHYPATRSRAPPIVALA